MVIQRILRHANASTTATYYIKTAADDVRNAMAKLEHHIGEAGGIQSGSKGTRSSAQLMPHRIAVAPGDFFQKIFVNGPLSLGHVQALADAVGNLLPRL